MTAPALSAPREGRDREGRPCPPGQVTTPVPGAPYQPGDRVRVVQVLDNTLTTEHLGLDEDADVEAYLVGRTGVVVHLNYDCGCGQRYPDDPMIGVLLEGRTAPTDPGEWPEFWPEELAAWAPDEATAT